MSTSRIKKRKKLRKKEKKKKDRRWQAGRFSPESRTNPKVGRKWRFFWEEHIKPDAKIQRNVKRPIDDIKYGRCLIIKMSVISARFTSA